ncbi:MAG: rRNA maturation RNase YbeY [Clostridia bacterium]|nr:rRNA maturation RNase YbeY [Clostridia bacterium]
MQIILDNTTPITTPDADMLSSVADYVLTQQNQPTQNISVGVFYVNAEDIQRINNDYRGKDYATDVISFRLIDNPHSLPITKENFPTDYDATLDTIYLGEIFICHEVAEAQALEYAHSTEREILELFAHGMLHLLGHDHENDTDREVMHTFELDIMNNLDKIIKKARVE